jgi:tetratricopeptide (TPR) repeat protein
VGTARGADDVARARKSARLPATTPVRVWPRALLIAAAAVLVYGAGIAGPFAFDDALTVVQNPQIRDLGNLHAVLSPMAHTALSGRPLASLSFAVNYALGGLDVTGYHVANIVLHVAYALLIFGLVRGTLVRFGDRGDRNAWSINVAFAVALIWTVHPLTTEVVDYLTQRTESMMAVCCLLTLYASMRSLDSHPRRWQTIAILACTAGAACKETIVVAPVLVVLYDRAFAFESFASAFRARWRLYAGLALTWIVLAALVAGNGQTISAGSESAPTSTWVYLLNQTVMITHYLRLAIWPHGLVLYYGWPQSLSLVNVWPYALLIVGLFIAAVVVWVRRPAVGFLGAWFFLLLAPTSSVLPIATEVGAERRMYLPLVAIVVLIVCGALFVWQRLQRSTVSSTGGWSGVTVGGAITVAVAVILAAGTVVRTREYQSPLVMAQTVLERWPTANAHNLVGAELVAAGRHDEAIQQFRAAAPALPVARFQLGSELLATGHADEGVAMLESFVKDEPHQLAARAALISIGRDYEGRQDWPRAIDAFTRILVIDSSDADAHGLLGEALAGDGQLVDAIPHYDAYLRAHPADANAWTALGVAVISCGRTNDAVVAFRNAVGAAPGNPHFRQNLARSLLAQGDVRDAAEQAQQATTLDPNDPAAHELLGEVLVKETRIDDARAEFKRALEIDPTFEPAREAYRALGRAGSF